MNQEEGKTMAEINKHTCPSCKTCIEEGCYECHGLIGEIGVE